MPEDRRHAAIMFTDIVGYTALMGKDEDRAFDMLRRNHAIHQDLIKKHNGTLIKEIGDGTLASFPLSSNAVRCAIDIQKEAKEQNIPLKIGIHEGEMVFAGIDVLGDSVNLASRLQEDAQDGCINISDSVYRNIRNKADIQTTLIGEKTFKNVDEPIKVYRVLLEEDLDDQLGFEEKRKRPKSKILYYILAGLTIIIIGILLIWKLYPTETIIELEKSIAVLPFKNLSNDPEQEWLVAGQHETMITELSKLSQVEPLLRVIGGYTVNSFRNSEKSLPEIAREIPVDYLIEGIISAIGDSIKLQLRLIQAMPEERIVFAQTFTGDISNIFRLFSNIAGKIAQKIYPNSFGKDTVKLPSARTVNPEACKAYFRGMYHLNMDTQEDKEKGLAFLNEAVRIDPGEPFAWAGLAQGYIEIAHGPLATGDDLIKAEAAANRAIKLDTSMAEIYEVMAEVYLYRLWEFEKAERYFVKALELDPNLALAHFHYAWALYLFGSTEDAINEHELAQKYDPFHPNITAQLSLLYCYIGRYEDALREAQKSLEIEKDYQGGYWAQGITYLAMGRTNDAIKVHKKLAELYPWWKWELGCTYANSDHRDEAEKILKELEKSEVNSFIALGLAVLNGALGNMDDAFKWLAYEPHHPWVLGLAVIPYYSKPFRDDPRFEDFLKRLNLPDRSPSK